MSWREGLSNSWLGGILRGIIKIGIAGVVAIMLNGINMDLSNVTLGGTTIDLSIIWDVIRIFAPLLLIVSGLRDMGVRL